MAATTSPDSANGPPDFARAVNAASSDPTCWTRSRKNGMLDHMGVLTPPGQTVLTRTATPWSRNSLAAVLASMHSPALLAEYAAAPPAALMPDADDTWTILPPAARIARIACLVPRNAPSRLIAMTRRQSARAISASGAPADTPALFTRMSNR